jgi:hypothetical protein
MITTTKKDTNVALMLTLLCAGVVAVAYFLLTMVR